MSKECFVFCMHGVNFIYDGMMFFFFFFFLLVELLEFELWVFFFFCTPR